VSRYTRGEAERGLEYPLSFGEVELEEARSCFNSISQGYRDWLTIRESDYFSGFIRARLKRLIPERTRMIDWIFDEARLEALPEALRRLGLLRPEDEGAVRRYRWPCCGADDVRGGPNGRLSLAQVRRNFSDMVASEPRVTRYVRPPWPAEFPEAGGVS
jgi:hypothetical protein